MNDKEIICNYLSILKSNIEVYVHGTIESFNQSIRDLINNGLQFTLDHQASTFDEMINNNMYKVENISSSEVCKCYKKIKKEV